MPRACVMRHDTDGRVTEVGARTRTIPPALRRALHHRDPGCRFPGCGAACGAGSPHPSLGSRRAHEALESRAPVSPASSRGPRSGLSGRAPIGRSASVQAARWADHSRRAAATRRADGSRSGDARAARAEWTGLAPADSNTRLARRAARCGLRHRRLASAGAEAAGPAAGRRRGASPARACASISISTVRLSAAVLTSRGNAMRTPCRRSPLRIRSRNPSRSTAIIVASSAASPAKWRA